MKDDGVEFLKLKCKECLKDFTIAWVAPGHPVICPHCQTPVEKDDGE